ncbi:LutC/YkgG family protein [Sphingomonas sp. AX6]|uniref:LutC/YkgG family protein n=1 Tax=Sphingomonas sp. AX6 TaxID=2653171 RepID=UPI0012F08B2D|nr:LUD domain-containing protein [Sphingomonas sp. AX6]VXC79016.1 conserved hypothetical protein [Sphingomonas sp. AX6]
MTARDAILAALSGDTATPDAIAAHAAALVGQVERPAPAGMLAEAFADALAKPSVGASFDHVANNHDVPAAVARYLAQHALPPLVHIACPMIETDWAPLATTQHLSIDGGVVVARAVSAVAESGTLVIDTGPDRPMLAHFLALHHIVIVHAADLVAQLEDIPEPAAIPRSRFWITGVSGTTDIEGQYIRGAHGPRFLHVILIGPQPR